MKDILALIVLVVALLLVGCATPPLGRVDSVRQMPSVYIMTRLINPMDAAFPIPIP